ncbi:MAG: energy transducer TonB [Limnohabitans sp.]|nr:energy transducer TonB [Limnohabitans sp.]
MKKITLFIFTFFALQTISAQATFTVASKSLALDYNIVETRPMFPGGNDEFVKFISKNFHTPEVEGLSGVLKVTFVVEANGAITDIKVINDLGSGTGEEAKRMLQQSPKWIPGEQNGEPVRVLYTLPIKIQN